VRPAPAGGKAPTRPAPGLTLEEGLGAAEIGLLGGDRACVSFLFVYQWLIKGLKIASPLCPWYVQGILATIRQRPRCW